MAVCSSEPNRRSSPSSMPGQRYYRPPWWRVDACRHSGGHWRSGSRYSRKYGLVDPNRVSIRLLPKACMLPRQTAMKPRVFNIPASVPFLPVLIDSLRTGKLVPGFPASDGPLELARATLYLPTRRACRMARDTFARAFDQAAILPRIVALGDLDEDEIVFSEATGDLAEAALALPPAIGPLDRQLLLAQLIVRWAAAIRPEKGAPLIANTPAAALALADDLARLIDDVITRKMDWQRLDGLVPDQFDTYWQLTLDFLKIARDYWPERLEENGEIDAAD